MAAGKPVLLLLLLFAARLVCAQSDSSQARLREVEVTASRASSFSVGSQLMPASAVQIKLKQQAPLPELLRQISPVYVKNYGPGNLASLSVRGTTANQSAIVWNGIQINAATNGLTDLNLIQPGVAQAVKLVSGPMSALYGSGAMGSTLFLDSEPANDSVYQIRLSQGAGSFSSYQSRIEGNFGGRNWQGQTSYGYASARNNFPFVNTYLTGKPEQQTTNARLYQHSLTQNLYFFPLQRYSVSVHGWYYASDRQIPPVMSVPESRASQTDKALRLAAVVKRSSAIGNTTFRAGYLADYLLYQNPQIYSVTQKPGRTFTWLTEAEQQYLVSGFLFNAGISVRATTGHVTEYGNRVAQSQQAIFLSALKQFKSGTTLAVTTRKEFVDGFDPDPTASVGAEQVLGLNSGVKLKAQVANSFRVPTLNERFWKPGGNPNLKPEKGISAEAGVSWSPTSKLRLVRALSLAGYTSEVKNMILWKQVSAFVYSPVNISQVWARGAEASAELAQNLWAGKKLEAGLRASYAYTRSTQVKAEIPAFAGKQLIYVPVHNASVFATLQTRYLNVGWQQNWQSTVFTSADNRERLAGYSLSDFLLWTPEVLLNKLQADIQLTVRNILNQNYQAIRNVPMPGRSYEIRLNLTIPYSTQQHATN